MKVVEVKICLGTTCFVLGNTELQELENNLPESIIPYVELMGATCFEKCKDSNYKRVPCAMVNGMILENVNMNDLVTYIIKAVHENIMTEKNNGK